jgi:hypothetical protein
VTDDTAEYRRAKARIEELLTDLGPDGRGHSTHSTSEKIAIALVLDTPALFPNGGYTILEAIDRVGPTWLRAAHDVQRARS